MRTLIRYGIVVNTCCEGAFFIGIRGASGWWNGGGVNLAKREEKGVKGPRDVGVGGGGARRGRERREALLRIRIQRGLLHVCTRVWS